jgi:hypothetical protein
MPYADADKARDYWREYRRSRRAGDCSTPGSTPVPPAFRLKVAADVIALLEDQIEAVLEDATAGTLEKARCAGYLAGIALKAIEAGNLAARLEALELVLKARTEAA